MERSSSPYCSPILLVPKKDASYRFCVDYRRLNAVTIPQSTTMPAVHETIRDLGTATVFTTLDLRAGYWQIPIEEDARKYTAFATPDGAKYQFRVMPFGLCNAPGSFQRLITQEVLVGFIQKFAMAYLDDIVVYSADWESHLTHLALVLERLQQHQLRCFPEKCQIGTTSIKYLGYNISTSGNSPFAYDSHKGF